MAANPSIEFRAEQDRDTQQRLAAYYTSEAALLPQLALQYRVPLNINIADALYGNTTGFAGMSTPSGLPRASFMLSKVVNGQSAPESLFDPTSEAPQPSHEALNRLAQTQKVGPVGRAFFGILRDSVYFEPGDEDNIVLPNNRPDNGSYTSASYDGLRTSHLAVFCANAERYFVEEGFDSGELKPIKVDGQLVALKKELGDQTALTTVPTVLNGVALPVGTLMTVETNWRGAAPKFGFGRLSMFNYATASEALQQMPSIARRRFQEEQARHRFVDQFAIFNEIVGRSAAENTPANWDESLEPLLIGAIEMAIEDRKIADQYNFSVSPHPLRKAVAKLQKARLAVASQATLA